MSEISSSVQTAIVEVMERYLDEVETALMDLWTNVRPKIKLYDSEHYEVLMGLIARQATLSAELASNPGTWTGHVAPLFLRAMTDVHITIAWILGDIDHRARLYILHGLGQEKLAIAHYEQGLADLDGDAADEVRELLDAKKAWLASQRVDMLTEVNLGSWSGVPVRDMADEAGLNDMYRFAYTPFSAAVHSMWNHVCFYNLRQCENALHRYHRVPVMAAVPLNPDFPYRSSKYLSQSLEAVSDAFGLAPPRVNLREWLAAAIESEYTAAKAHTGTEGTSDGT